MVQVRLTNPESGEEDTDLRTLYEKALSIGRLLTDAWCRIEKILTGLSLIKRFESPRNMI